MAFDIGMRGSLSFVAGAVKARSLTHERRAGTGRYPGRGAGTRREAARRPSRRSPPNRPTRSSRSRPTIPSPRSFSAHRTARAAMRLRRSRSSSRSPPPSRAGRRALRTRARARDCRARRRSGRRAARAPCSCKPDDGRCLARARRSPARRMGDAQGADAAYAQHIRPRRAIRACSNPRRRSGEGRIAVAEPLLRDHLKQIPDRRGGDPHAGRGRGAPRPLRRRREPARALPGTGAGLQRRAAQLRRRAAPAEQAGRGARARSTGCSRPNRATRAAAT